MTKLIIFFSFVVLKPLPTSQIPFSKEAVFQMIVNRAQTIDSQGGARLFKDMEHDGSSQCICFQRLPEREVMTLDFEEKGYLTL